MVAPPGEDASGAGRHSVPDLWVYQLGSSATADTRLLLDRMSRAGVRVVPFEPLGASVAVGLVLFDTFTTELVDFVRTSATATTRLIAAALHPAALHGAGAWQLLRAGVTDVLEWSPERDMAEEVVARLARWTEVDALVALQRERLVGQSPTWRALLRQVIEVARFSDSSVLLLGESGTGKEMVARLIHDLDPRPGKRTFVILDCTTIVPELSGSEFFGHERGAFTGAVSNRDGAFALADGGTLFLDEVGELPLGLQAELLRVVQEGTYKRLGSNDWRRTRFRLVCATHRELERERAEGRFRSDFYYRIAGSSCRLPPLAERVEDILPLARHFCTEAMGRGPAPDFDPSVTHFLTQRAYPGNVRELRQIIAQLLRRHVGPGPITPGDASESERQTVLAERADWRDGQLEAVLRRALSLGASLRDISGATVETAIRLAVAEAGGSLHRAAQRLGVTDRALQLRRANQRDCLRSHGNCPIDATTPDRRSGGRCQLPGAPTATPGADPAGGPAEN